MALTRKEINAVMKAEYPLNLLHMIQNQLDGRRVQIDLNHVTEDMLCGLDYALSMLDPRSADILRMKYRERMTTTEIVDIIGVKSVNALADSALHKLTKPSMLGYVIYGKQGFEKLLSEYKSKIPDSILDHPIEEIEVSAYVQWASRELHMNTLRELTYLMPGTLQVISEKLSPMNIDELSKFFRSLGEKHPVWSLADKKEKTYPTDNPREGDLYKTITLGGKKIDIRYRKYDDLGEGVTIDFEVKCFANDPEYTEDGFAFRNAQDEVCTYLVPKKKDNDRCFTCDTCSHFTNRVEFIGICDCTGKRQRGVKTPLSGKEMRIAVIGELSVARDIVCDAYKDVEFDHYESVSDLSVIVKKQNIVYDLILIRCEENGVLSDMQLISRYRVEGKRVDVPVILLSEPPTYEAELELDKFVVSLGRKKQIVTNS